MHIGRKLVYLVFATLLVTALSLSNAIQGNAADYADLPADAQHIKPLRAGDRAPAFAVRTVDDELFEFEPGGLSRVTVIVSYRGGWCPYCNMHLAELHTVVPKIRARGIDIFFLSGDRPEILRSSLQRETRETIAGLDYRIFSDADMDAARAFGTAFRVDEGYIARLDAKGIDLAGSSIRKFSALPVPSVYIIDRSGNIVFDYVNADYKIRLSAEELLAAATAAAAD